MKRYKRFLADVEWGCALEKGPSLETVYCPNTGSMLNLIEPFNTLPQCICSVTNNTKRKYTHTLEMIQAQQGSWVGVHSALANDMVENALVAGLIDGCRDFQTLKREVKVDTDEEPMSRVDFELSWEGGKMMLLEVKSVTLRLLDGSTAAVFPDAVSERGQKHLRCLTAHVRKGGHAGVLFLIQRDDVTEFSASDLDPQYVRLLHEAAAAGVVVLPYRCALDPEAGTVTLLDRLPFVDTYDPNTVDKSPTKKRKAVGSAAKSSGKK